MAQELNFTVDSRLLEELGENLVTKNHIALAELIKNAYDADASQVTVRMEDATKESSEGRIIIDDDGTGMSPENIDEKWMRIATTDKIRNPVSDKYGREKVGNKGIGRFACRRLARKLKLISVSKDKSGDLIRSKVDFDWHEEFERGQDIDEPKFEIDTEKLEYGSTDTKIILENLRDSWTQRDFNTLKREVVSLSAAEPTKREVDGEIVEDPGFEITLEAPEFESEGSLKEEAKEAGWGRLHVQIDEQGKVKLVLNAKKLGEVEYELPKRNYSELSGTEMDIAYIPRAREHFRDTSTLSLGAAKEMLDKYGGIMVYQRGFRVYPYGGPEGDWLGINKFHGKRTPPPEDIFDSLEEELSFAKGYSRSMISFPRNSTLLGEIHLDAPIKQKADREGFIEDNPVFSKLQNVALECLQWMTLQYDHYLAKIAKEEMDESREEFESSTGKEVSTPRDAAEYIEDFSENVEKVVDDPDVQKAAESADEAVSILKNSIKEKDEQLEFLRSVFSVNQLVFSFAHETSSMLQNVGKTAERVEELMSEIDDEFRDDLKELSNQLSDVEETFREQVSIFRLFLDQKADTEAVPLKVGKNLTRICDVLDGIITDKNINVEYEIEGRRLKTPEMNKAEFYSIAINLITNSIKAILAENGEKGGTILIEAFKKDEEFVFRVYDNGIGFSGDEEEAFSPLTADPEDELYTEIEEQIPLELGSGSGLGLNVLREIARVYKGDAQFVNPNRDNFSTCVEVILPYD